MTFDIPLAESDDQRRGRLVGAIDAANAEDPATLAVAGVEEPRALVQGRMATEWVERLLESPTETLWIAARGHHIRRWEIPRRNYPSGRQGYLDWRRRLYDFQAEQLGTLMGGEGYETPEIDRVAAIVRKERLKTDRFVQTFEDALCLVFLETQLGDFTEQLPEPETLDRILVRTWRKMSEAGRQAALALTLDDRGRIALERALGQA